jgi:preprotein translocase subunit YajC
MAGRQPWQGTAQGITKAPPAWLHWPCFRLYSAHFQKRPKRADPECLMLFIAPAYAQGAAAPGSDILVSLVPFVLIFVIMWFLIIRPQRAQMKKRDEMLKNIRRNDTIVTGGGVIAKVTKINDGDADLEVEIAQGVKVRVLRAMISDVRAKGEPVPANDQK